MKTIMFILKTKDLDKTIKTIAGREAMDVDGLRITFRKALVACCGVYQPSESANPRMGITPVQLGEEAIRAYNLGLQLFKSSKDLEIETQDQELLEKIVQCNKLFVSFITAQLLELLALENKNPKVGEPS